MSVTLVCVALGLLAGGCLVGTGQPGPPPLEDVDPVPAPSFARDIQPILDDFCVKCHSRLDAHAGLRLDSFEQLMQGSPTGPVVKPGNPDDSRLLEVIKHQLEPSMPFHGEKLTPNRITNIERWIEQGARQE